MLSRALTTRASFTTLALAIAIAACSDEPVKKRLGGTCGDDADCAEGVCGGGICLDPSLDDDVDGLQNGLEIALGTNPVAGDTDNDGLGDKVELDQSLGLLDIDGDGTADVLESATADGDGDCLPDQYDPDNTVANNDLTGLVPVVCRQAGVCAGAALAVGCPDGPGSARCDYGAVAGYEAEEATCDGRDNDCDGATDEHDVDSDDDGVADCEDPDDDGDGKDDDDDNCPGVDNADQADADGDDRGDACDPPAVPVVVAILPGPIGNVDTPTVVVRCEAGSTVHVLAAPENPCDTTGPVTATCADPDATELAIGVTGARNQLATRAVNAAGVESACVTAALDYTLDTAPPASATGVATSPASPSSTATPTVSGEAEPGATLTFFTDASCTGDAVGEGRADAGGAFEITLALPGDGAYTLRVVVTDVAGNATSCAPALASDLVVATAAPADPTAAATPFSPASPSSGASVTVAGCAATDATTTLHLGSCAAVGTAVGAGAGACPTGMSPFVATVVMPDDALTQVFARSTSASGVTSSCAWLGAFLHDDTAPVAPTLVGVSPPSPSAAPALALEVDTHGEAASYWLAPGCSGAPAGALLDGDNTLVPPSNQTFTVYARAFDAAGNASTCASLLTYTHDARAPIAPSLHPTPFSPASPAPSLVPVVTACTTGSAPVSVFATAGCAGAPLATLTTLADDARCPAGRAASGAVAALDSETLVLSGRVTSATGVPSGCAYLGSYTHDDEAPAAPTFGSAVPASPSPARTPRLSGQAEAGARVDLHLGGCAGPIRGSGVADGAGAWTIGLDLPIDQASSIFARATDAAGNTSCAALTTYVVDTIPPLPPTGIMGIKGGPSFPDVGVGGCAEGGLDVVIATSPTCAPVVATVTATASDPSCPAPPVRGAFGATVTVEPEVETRIYAAAVDAAGNRSSCVLMDEVFWDSTAPGEATITDTRASAWDDDLTFDVRGVVASEDTRLVRLYEVAEAFAGGPCPGAPIGSGSSDGAEFTATATVASGAARAIAAQAIDAQGNAGACGPARTLVARSTATALRPDEETGTTWVTAEGGHVFWHFPDGRLASFQDIADEDPVPAHFTFEGMFATVGLTVPGDGYDEHVLGSYALAPGEDVVFEIGALAESGPPTPWAPVWPLWVSIDGPPLTCFGCQMYVLLRCGESTPSYYESTYAELSLYPECMQDLVCHAVDENGACVEYDFALDMVFVMLDGNNELLYFAIPPTQRFDEADVEISLSFVEGVSWREDFDEVEVTATNATGEPRISYFSIDSVWDGREWRLPGRDPALAALPAMPAQAYAKLVPGLDEGTTTQLVKMLQLGGDGDNGDGGLTGIVQAYQRRTGPPPTTVHYALDELLPFILPVAMPDYADPDRPYFELYALGDRAAEASVVRMSLERQSDLGAGAELRWTYVMSGERRFAFQYPEFPPSMPELGFSYYDDSLDVDFVNVDFDFTSGWEDLRAYFGWRLLTLFGGGSAPDDLPSDFGFEMSICCGGSGRSP